MFRYKIYKRIKFKDGSNALSVLYERTFNFFEFRNFFLKGRPNGIFVVEKFLLGVSMGFEDMYLYVN